MGECQFLFTFHPASSNCHKADNRGGCAVKTGNDAKPKQPSSFQAWTVGRDALQLAPAFCVHQKKNVFDADGQGREGIDLGLILALLLFSPSLNLPLGRKISQDALRVSFSLFSPPSFNVSAGSIDRRLQGKWRESEQQLHGQVRQSNHVLLSYIHFLYDILCRGHVKGITLST